MTEMIPLSTKHGIGKFTIIDDEDYERVSVLKWAGTWDGYAVHIFNIPKGNGLYAQKPMQLHRFILNAPSGLVVDHANKNTLDNRHCNLRLANRSQNAANSPPRAGTSKFKGVRWVKERSIWRASIGVNSHYRTLGEFANEEAAACAYDRAAVAAWGEFAYLNFPELLR